MIMGLVGYAGAGKDEVGRILLGMSYARGKHKALKEWRRAAFADALKADVGALLSWPKEDVDQRKDITRDLLVFYGNWAREHLGANWWIDRLVDEAPGYAEWAEREDLNLVITDVRYINEATWIKECNGFVVAVINPHVAGACIEEETSIRKIADAGMYDAVIRNMGTLDFLKSEVDRVLDELQSLQENRKSK